MRKQKKTIGPAVHNYYLDDVDDVDVPDLTWPDPHGWAAALAGSPLVSRIAGKTLTTIFEMGAGLLFDDAMPADRIAALAKDRAAMAQREAQHEAQFKGQFELL